MCFYVLLVPLCGHSPSLLFGPSCYAFFEQLNAINEPAAWEPPGLYELPFRLPDSCLPSAANIVIMHSPDFCSTCRAEHLQFRAAGDGQEECLLGNWPGMGSRADPADPHALCGAGASAERIGVGWRM